MKTILISAAFAAIAVTAPAAQAQNAAGVAAGVATGAVVGGALAVGIVDAQRPRFRSYVVSRSHPSYRWGESVRIGAVLPDDGIEYYDVPEDYGVRGHRYTVVNGETVLVEPRTRRVIQVIE